MSGFDLFDTGPIAPPVAPPIPVPAPPRDADRNPILNRSAGPVTAPDVAKCSPSVAALAEQQIAPETAENRHSQAEAPESVASVASVADCRAGVGLLASLPPFEYIPRADWDTLVADAEAFERMWLDEAIEKGWSLLEMFGCNRRPFPLARRLDLDGLVVSLNGRTIESIAADHAVIRERRNTLRFFRTFDFRGAVPIWVAYAGGAK